VLLKCRTYQLSTGKYSNLAVNLSLQGIFCSPRTIAIHLTNTSGQLLLFLPDGLVKRRCDEDQQRKSCNLEREVVVTYFKAHNRTNV
jgi:hypothetical protein